MDKLRLAFYSDTYSPAVDGVVISILNFKKELEKRGHKVYIFASGDSNAQRKFSSKDTFISRGIRFNPYPQYRVALFPYTSILKLNALKVDLIHAHTPFSMGMAALAIAKLGRYPLAGTFHTMINNKQIVDAYYAKNKFLREMTSKYMCKYAVFFYKQCNTTIVPSESIKKLMANAGVENIHVVPNSVDVHAFNPNVDGSSTRKKLGLSNRDKVILYVGRTSKEKRLEDLLKAVKVLSSKDNRIKLVIAGAGPALDHYKHLAVKLGIGNSTKFLGMVPHDKLPEIYAMSDVFSIPSTFETQGIVALEAMASGKPVVGANYLALKELIQSGVNGEKFDAGDYKGCAKQLTKVLNNSSTYNKGAVKTAQEFSIERTTDKLINAYRLLLSETR